MASAIEKLTDGQKQCLRLVLQLKQTKEIARELGIAPDTVKQRIGIAMRTLGVDTRIQAARLLETHENPVYPRQVYPPREVGTPPSDASGRSSTDGPGDAAEGASPPSRTAPDTPSVSTPAETPDALTLREMTADLIARWTIGQPDRPGGGAGNRLGPLQRILLIMLVALGAVLSVTGLIAAIHELAALKI